MAVTKAINKDGFNPKRNVHCFNPLESDDLHVIDRGLFETKKTPLKRNMQSHDLFALNAFASKLPAKQSFINATKPRPIPGASEGDLERQTSLIKAVPATKIPFYTRNLNPTEKPKINHHLQEMPIAEGSWTDRKLIFDVDNLDEQPSACPKILAKAKARAVAIETRSKARNSQNSHDLDATDDVAWRFRMKKKWIREELHARRMDFPDDPDYRDIWQDAESFVAKVGVNATLQAAYLEGPRSHTSDESDDTEFDFEDVFGDFDNDDDEYVEPPKERGLLKDVLSVKAAELIRIQNWVQAA